MIVLTIEIWPKGEERRKRLVGRTFITNRGYNGDRRDYSVQVCRRGSKYSPEGPFTRSGTVSQFPSVSYNIWRLIIRALVIAFPEER